MFSQPVCVSFQNNKQEMDMVLPNFVYSSCVDQTETSNQAHKKRKQGGNLVMNIKKQKRDACYLTSLDRCVLFFGVLTCLDIKSSCSFLIAMQPKQHKRNSEMMRLINWKRSSNPFFCSIPYHNLGSLAWWENIFLQNRANSHTSQKVCSLCSGGLQPRCHQRSTCLKTGLVVCASCRKTAFRTPMFLRCFVDKKKLDDVDSWTSFNTDQSRLFAPCDIAPLGIRLSSTQALVPASDVYMKQVIDYAQILGRTIPYATVSCVEITHWCYIRQIDYEQYFTPALVRQDLAKYPLLAGLLKYKNDLESVWKDMASISGMIQRYWSGDLMARFLRCCYYRNGSIYQQQPTKQMDIFLAPSVLCILMSYESSKSKQFLCFDTAV
jgi:hypothetical protein